MDPQEISTGEIARRLDMLQDDLKEYDMRIQKLEARINYLFGGMGVLVIVVNLFEVLSKHLT